MNQIRCLLLERGHVVLQGSVKLNAHLAELIEGEASTLTPVSVICLLTCANTGSRSANGSRRSAEFVEAERDDTRVQWLLTISGVGALNTTALVARATTQPAVLLLTP